MKLGEASTTEWSQDSNAWGSSLEKKVDQGLTSLAAHCHSASEEHKDRTAANSPLCGVLFCGSPLARLTPVHTKESQEGH